MPYVFMLDSGRSALLIVMDVLDCAGREVLVNAYTTDVVHKAIMAAGAMPRPFDLIPETLEPDLDSVRRSWSNNTAALIHTRLFGLPCNPTGLRQEARQWGIPMVNCLGILWRGHLCGQFGQAAILSFRVGKPLSSGGGALVTNSPAIAEKIAARMKTVPQTPKALSLRQLLRSLADYIAFEPFILRYVARPLRSITKGTVLGRQLVRGGVVDTTNPPDRKLVRWMGQWQAALALANLDEYQDRIQTRQQVGKLIIARCHDLPLRFLVDEKKDDWNGLFLPVLLPSDCANRFVEWMRCHGFDVTRFHAAVPSLSFDRSVLHDLPGTRFISRRLVCVPSTVRMFMQVDRFYTVARSFLEAAV